MIILRAHPVNDKVCIECVLEDVARGTLHDRMISTFVPGSVENRLFFAIKGFEHNLDSPLLRNAWELQERHFTYGRSLIALASHCRAKGWLWNQAAIKTSNLCSLFYFQLGHYLMVVWHYICSAWRLLVGVQGHNAVERSGKLTVTRNCKEQDLNTEDWQVELTHAVIFNVRMVDSIAMINWCTW